jgi:hypothetical protein
MLTIRVMATCPVDQDEIVACLIEQAEWDLEERIGLLLHDMFDIVLVEHVSITISSPEEPGGNTSLAA